MTPSPKINLSSIMKTKEDLDNKNTTPTEYTKEIEKVKTEEGSENIKSKKIDLNFIKANKEKDPIKTQEQDILNSKDEIKDKPEIKEKAEMFSNYKSDFIKKETSIFEKIEEKKKKIQIQLKKPKTRILLVISLIGITVLSIGALFTLDPENHSIETYKANILANIKNIKKTYIDKPWVDEIITIEDYSFNILFQETNGGKNYKYKNITYTTKKELNRILNSEIKIKKDELAKIEAERIEKEIETKKIEKEKAQKELIKNILFEKFK